MKKKSVILFALMLLLALGSVAFAGCAKTYSGLRIDAPEHIEADLGVYKIPQYNLVDENGVIFSGSDYGEFKVNVISVTDHNGKTVEVINDSVYVTVAGKYKFVYGVSAKGISNVTVTVDFADRTAPTIAVESSVPSLFIVGNSYEMPLYSISGDYVTEKCYAKLYVSDDEAGTNLTELTVKDNMISPATEHKGKYYLLRFHAEDAAGNINDYDYYRAVDGAETIVPHTVAYFNEAFGARQVAVQESYYTGEYAAKGEGVQVYGDEGGAYKLSFTGTQKTRNNEGYVIVNSPALSDLRAYTELEFYVYFDPGDTSALPEVEGIDYTKLNPIVAMPWSSDTPIKANAWSKVSFNIQNWSCVDISESPAKPVYRSDITKMRLRFIFDYGAKVMPFGTFYISRMYAVPGELSVIEPTDSNVWTNDSTYYKTQTVTLNAQDAPRGKTFDCFTVDGEPISGNTFVATKDSHVVEAVYVDGDLTYDNMKWGSAFTNAEKTLPSGHYAFFTERDTTAMTAGSAKYWAESFELAGIEAITGKEGDQVFVVSVMFGNTRLASFVIKGSGESATGEFTHYGNGNYSKIKDLTPDMAKKFAAASEQNPVTVSAVRLGDYVHIYVDNAYFHTVTVPGLTMYGDYFGYAFRWDTTYSSGDGVSYKVITHKPIIKNAKAVLGELKANLVFEKLSEEVAVTLDEKVTADKSAYKQGSVVTLTAAPAGKNEFFCYFTVDGKAIQGNTFAATANCTVAAVYKTVTCDDNVTLDKTEFAVGDVLTLTAAPAPTGKMFVHFTANNVALDGNTYTLKAESVSFKAVYSDASTLTLANGITANGQSGTVTVPRGATIVLAYTGALENGILVDFFTAGETKIYNGEFIPTENAYNITVTLANKAEFTWGGDTSDTRSYDIASASGSAAVWQDWSFNGEIFGKSEYWAIQVKTDTPKNANGGNEWGSIDFIMGDKESLRIRVNGTSWFGIYARKDGAFAEYYPQGHSEFYPAWVNGGSADRKAHASAIAGGTNALTCVRNGDTVLLFIGDELIFTTHYKFNRIENWFGVASKIVGDDKAAMPTNDTKYIVGQDKVEALLASKQATFTCADNVTVNGQSGTVTVFSGNVTLGYSDVPNDQIVDYYTVNGTQVFGNTFAAAGGASYSISATLATVSTMTWQNGSPKDLTTATEAEGGVSNDIKGEMNNNNLKTAYTLGKGDKWAISLQVYGGYNAEHASEKYGLIFQVDDWSWFGIEYFNDGGTVAPRLRYVGGNWDVVQTLDIQNASLQKLLNATQSAPVTVTCIKNGDDLYLYVDNVLLCKTAWKGKYGGAQYGYGYRGSQTPPTFADVKVLTESAKIDFYLASFPAQA